MDRSGDRPDQGQELIPDGCYAIVTRLTACWVS
jgi:hypothetical protein